VYSFVTQPLENGFAIRASGGGSTLLARVRRPACSFMIRLIRKFGDVEEADRVRAVGA